MCYILEYQSLYRKYLFQSLTFVTAVVGDHPLVVLMMVRFQLAPFNISDFDCLVEEIIDSLVRIARGVSGSGPKKVFNMLFLMI